MARRRRPPSLASFAAVILSVAASAVAVARTDQKDVDALNILFTSTNKPSALSGWKESGGNPCDDEWKGIRCSGSSVTEIDLFGLGLSGTLGYQLSNLKSVTKFDASSNKLNGDIPYALPPNLVQLNLQGNSFTGGAPYSISQMSDLETLNLGHNQLNGQLTDMFSHLPKLSAMDLSFNNFSGTLPQSFQYLNGIKTLNLESNQFSGKIDVLAKLPLDDLNLQNNKFTGWIPGKLQDIGSLKTGRNAWSSGPAPPGMVKGSSVESPSSGDGSSSIGITCFIIGGMVIAVLLAALIILSVLKRRKSSTVSSQYYLDDSGHRGGIAMKQLEQSASMESSRTPPAMPRKSINDDEFENKLNISRRMSDPNSLRTFLSSDLQAATGNFHSSRLIGQGTIARVYKAKYADDRVLAVKKFDPLTFSGSSDFMDVVNDISKLHHPNICGLIGFCSEAGLYMLVYDYQSNGSLYDFLHLSDDYSKPLTWDTRVRLALGTARALEYLHEACSPPVVHENIKSSNVLLDADLNPHLSDSGFSCLYEDTIERLGPGYSAPECTKPFGYVMKSDVYSFGVVMLELLTGRKPYDSSRPRAEQLLVKFVAPQLHDIDALGTLADSATHGLYPPKALSRFAEVVARCVQAEPELRPTMGDVAQSLNGCVQRSTSSRRIGGGGAMSQRSDVSDW